MKARECPQYQAKDNPVYKNPSQLVSLRKEGQFVGCEIFLPLKMLACQWVVFLQLSKDKQRPSEISSKNLGETKLLATARLREAGTLSCPLPISQCSTYRWLSGSFSQSECQGQEFQVYRRFLEHLPWLCDLPQSSLQCFHFPVVGMAVPSSLERDVSLWDWRWLISSPATKESEQRPRKLFQTLAISYFLTSVHPSLPIPYP